MQQQLAYFDQSQHATTESALQRPLAEYDRKTNTPAHRNDACEDEQSTESQAKNSESVVSAKTMLNVVSAEPANIRQEVPSSEDKNAVHTNANTAHNKRSECSSASYTRWQQSTRTQEQRATCDTSEVVKRLQIRSTANTKWRKPAATNESSVVCMLTNNAELIRAH